MLPKICTFPECAKGHFSSGLCGTHYRAAKPPCTFEECAKPQHAKGYCGRHYRRIQRYGDVNATAFIVGNDTARFWSYVEKTETCWNWTGAKDRGGYGSFMMGGTHYGVHRLSYQWEIGDIPQGLDIDHTCRNRACVNPGHLRTATRRQNNENRDGARASNISGTRGVQWVERNQKWRVTVGHYGKSIHVGMFADLTEAEAAAVSKRNELHTHNDTDRIAA